MLLEQRLNQIHRKAHDALFACYIRKGVAHPLLLEYLKATESVDAFIAYQEKFNPNHDALGRFTFGAGTSEADNDSENNNSDRSTNAVVSQAIAALQRAFGSGSAGTSSGDNNASGPTPTSNPQEAPSNVGIYSLLKEIQSKTLAQQPSSGADPGSKSITYSDGSTVMNPNPEPKFNGPLAVPNGVSISNNIEIGKSLKNLPSIFQDSTASGNFLPEKEAAMTVLFGSNQPMDYQRLYSDTDNINTEYIDFGNYNFGAVAAAAGYSQNEALLGAGIRNVLTTTFKTGPSDIAGILSSGKPDTFSQLQTEFGKLVDKVSGSYGNNPRVELLIRQGFGDYESRKI